MISQRIGDYDSSLPVAPDTRGSFTSMSGYEKTDESYVYDYATTRSAQESSYATFAQPAFASQYSDAQPQEPHALSAPVQLPYIAGSSYEARDASFPQHYSSFISARSRQLPEIISYSPLKYVHGQKLSIWIRTAHDLETEPLPFYSVMFGGIRGKKAEATLTTSRHQAGDSYYDYEITADIPHFDASGVGALDPGQVPLLLRMDDEYGNSLGVVEVGAFSYGDAGPYSAYRSPPRKRKREDELEELATGKRAVVPQMQSGPPGGATAYQSSLQHYTPTASPFLHPSTPNTYGYTAAYDRQQHQQQPYSGRPMQKMSYRYSSVTAAPQSNITAQSPSLSSYSPYSAASQPSRSPGRGSASIGSRSQVMPSPSALANPPLVRTSSLLPTSNTPKPAGPSSAFNPYAMYPNSKAVLKIDGDLEKMAENWTREELEAKRRLVVFKRSQSGSTITTSFEAVSPENHSQGSICVSCIFWEEQQECYVTSVDTIYLLESLVAVRFTVEEKNRIRRNLEGFRPKTVSKAKADSEEFFKVIMSFSNPKPRNIEKDVKVFPWKILSHALKKIISKYSASYSSTAGALPTPVTSGYTSGGPSESSTEAPHTVSPRSSSSMTSTAISPNIRAASGGLDPSAGPPAWQPQYYAPQHPAGMPTGRASWDFASTFDTTSLTAAASAGQTLPLHRASIGSGSYQASSAEAYQNTLQGSQSGHRTSRA